MGAESMMPRIRAMKWREMPVRKFDLTNLLFIWTYFTLPTLEQKLHDAKEDLKEKGSEIYESAREKVDQAKKVCFFW